MNQVRNDPDQHPDDPSNYPDDEPNEPMTGWDVELTPAEIANITTGAGAALLVAINRYLTTHGPDDVRHPELMLARNTVIQAMHQIDWNAMDFTQTAIDHGEDLWSCHPGHDVLTKYTPRRTRDEQQTEFAF